MTNLSLTIRYRPVRIGWCVRHGNWDDLRAALRLTHIFWGGKFNPIIPVGTTSATDLARQFRVDALFPVDQSPELAEFTKRSASLAWPLYEIALFNSSGNTPNFLDISHPLIKIARELRLHDRMNSSKEAPPQRSNRAITSLLAGMRTTRSVISCSLRSEHFLQRLRPDATTKPSFSQTSEHSPTRREQVKRCQRN